MIPSTTERISVLSTYASRTRPVAGHALYRHYDRAGNLLYVGITNDPARRWRDHTVHSPWAARRFVAWVEVVWFPDYRSAEAAEREAIRAALPLFNKRRRGLRVEAARRLGVYLDAPDPETAAAELGTLRRVRCRFLPGSTCVSCGPDAGALVA